MEKFDVSGMSCAACSARVEKAVKSVDGVTSCSVSLLTNSMGVEGDADPQKIIDAVKEAGYGADLQGEKKSTTQNADSLKDTETPKLKKRLLWSLGFLILLMYVSMGHTMWNFPLPSVLANNPLAIGLVEMVLSAIVMVINQKFFISGVKGIIHRSPNMDTLVSMGSGVSFIYSTFILFKMSNDYVAGNILESSAYLHQLYFESAAMILTLITVGKMLEARSKGKTTDALKGLMNLAPKKATVIKNGVETEVSIESVKKGDVFVVKAGESIPVDGVIIEGGSAIDESALTGESVPVDKKIGDLVSGATINRSGYIKCEATRVGEDTTLSQIIKMVSDAAATKAPIAKIADKVSGIFVPTVITIAVITTIIWLFVGESFGFALARGISVLVISCPCALGLATPVAIMVGNGVGAKNGILFKTAVSLEQTGKTQIVALDKTGTITYGEPKVTDILTNDNVLENDLLMYAYSLESKSEHPLAKAINDKCKDMNIKPFSVEDFEEITGSGLKGKTENGMIFGGNYKFISSKATINDTVKTQAENLANEGKTPLFFCKDNEFLGAVVVADTIKEDSPKAIKELQNMGIKVVMLTGDNEKTANAIGKKAGVDEIVAGVLPQQKESVIKNLKTEGKVIMVGDGINDAPALTRADMGIAIGAGTDVAIDAADIVLMKSRLSDVPAAIRLSRATLRNIHENLFWAFFYNSIGIPLAAGAFISLLGWEMNPMFGAAAMSLSSFCVVTNALRLNFFNIRNSKHDRKIKQNKMSVKETKEELSMEKTVKIEGMMCPHCEANVKATLEGLDGIEEAVVSHTLGTAVITLSNPVDDEVIKKAIENKGYKVID